MPSGAWLDWSTSEARRARQVDRAAIIAATLNPRPGSWLNLVGWFGIIERQAIRRGTFGSVRDLMIKMRAFITGWNARKHPFI
jgi:hypothetical protein